MTRLTQSLLCVVRRCFGPPVVLVSKNTFVGSLSKSLLRNRHRLTSLRFGSLIPGIGGERMVRLTSCFLSIVRVRKIVVTEVDDARRFSIGRRRASIGHFNAANRSQLKTSLGWFVFGLDLRVRSCGRRAV